MEKLRTLSRGKREKTEAVATMRLGFESGGAEKRGGGGGGVVVVESMRGGDVGLEDERDRNTIYPTPLSPHTSNRSLSLGPTGERPHQSSSASPSACMDNGGTAEQLTQR